MTTTLGDLSIYNPNLNQLTSGALLKPWFPESNFYSELRILYAGVQSGGSGFCPRFLLRAALSICPWCDSERW